MIQIKSLRIIIKPLFFLSIIIVALTSRLSFCQDNLKKDNDTNEVVNIKPGVIHLSDSLLAAEKIFNDSLLSKLKDKSLHVIEMFSASADSISKSVEDSLILARKDSLRLVRSFLHKSIISQAESFSQKLNLIPIHYSEKVKSIKLLTLNDESVASGTLGRIDEEFRDVLTTPMNDYSDNLNDYVDNAVDSLGNYAQVLLDNQNDENDLLDSLWDNYYTYGLFGKIGYTTDMQYRGYHGPVAQSAFFPGLFYRHPIGLGALFNVYNIKGTIVPWDEIEFGLSYNYSFNDNFSFGLSYTHFTFNDTSEIAKQGITGITDISLTYEFPFVSIGASFDVSFGQETDYSFSIDFSKRIDLIKKPAFRC